MEVFLSKMRDAGLLLKATADITGNWRQNERGNGTFGKGSIPYAGDRSIEISLNVRVRPHGKPRYFAAFPDNLKTDGDLVWGARGAFGFFAIAHGRTGVAVYAGKLQEEMEDQEDKPIYFDKITLLKTGPARIQMNVSICLRSAPAVPRGDIPEWNTQFFSGGLPSLGKRRP